jgi:hypothetical protein
VTREQDGAVLHIDNPVGGGDVIRQGAERVLDGNGLQPALGK